jgi:VanZ family protein
MHARTCLVLALAYLAFIVYGSLIPFHFTPRDLALAYAEFRQTPYLRLGIGSRADWVANILLYMPLTFLLAAAWMPRCRGTPRKIALAALIVSLGAATAVAVEFTQLFFPRRTVSLNDIYAEIIGSGLGLAAWLGFGQSLAGLVRALGTRSARTPYLLALLYLAGYLAFAGFPYDFLVSRQEFAWKINSGLFGAWLARHACRTGPVCGFFWASEVLAALPLGLALGLFLARRPGQAGLTLAAVAGAAAGIALEALQFTVASGVSQGASALLRALGIVLGFMAFEMVSPAALRRNLATLAQPLFLIPLAVFYAGLAGALLWADKGPLLDLEAAADRWSEVRFTPFYYHYFTTETRAVHSLVRYFGFYLPLGVAVGAARSFPGFGSGLALAGLAGFTAAFGVEAVKLFLAKAYPDPTNALIGAFGAGCGYWAAHRFRFGEPEACRPRPALPALLVLAAGIGLLLHTFGKLAAATRAAAAEQHPAALPEPQQMPVAWLPRFEFAHPRLLAPSPAEWSELKADNPDFLKRTARRAQAGDFDALLMAAQAGRDPADLERLFRQLMAAEFTGRGQDQVLPLAYAYDWFHGRWTAGQRGALLQKTLDGCRYEIDLIRDQQLSPYNVYLYNSPFQALVACAVAVYGDHREAAPVMNFTYDLWKNRVLPVWRQVMGRHGGWHEGGEYVGIGIGQAVYRVPALWRKATGEDLFRAEPGLRGFLDFLVYRTRPDGTYIRLGDAGFFGRDAPDRLPLAIEYGHQAAYSLGGCPPPYEPSAQPWGPLTRPELCNPDAVEALPPDRLFDGIGLLIARSDWGPDATLVTFKAGDNYWSHSHLDQGSFTVYKGGALAIDSGLYGPHYGSDHHLNYTYQTIAHNAVTVTDPGDTVPPDRTAARPIANDGGQRRVGSGWGEPAPLDLGDWERHRQTYHTGAILHHYSGHDLVLAVADLTPAYTNRRSGRGGFADRTRRVERLVRSFLYDRVNDVIVIHDRVRATDPGFVKRSLVHSLEAPLRTDHGFRVSVPPAAGPGRSGGTLEVQVLLPERAFLDAVGGPGAEFWVDGRNYDEGGEVWKMAERRPLAEPGRWRMEIRPRKAAEEDEFLMVLKPRLAGRPEPRVEVRKIGRRGRNGCEIRGTGRSLAVYFSEGELPQVEIDSKLLNIGP